MSNNQDAVFQVLIERLVTALERTAVASERQIQISAELLKQCQASGVTQSVQERTLIIGYRVIFFDHVTRIKFDERSGAAFVHFSDGEMWELCKDEAAQVKKYLSVEGVCFIRAV